jgi:hypothetical protein
VRAKLVRIHAPDLSADELGVHAGVVAAVADEDRVAAKLLMHLALAAADGDADGPAFRAACALAWRDEPTVATSCCRSDVPTRRRCWRRARRPRGPGP